MGKQIFQTDNTSRWNKFKWSLRFILFLVGILIAVFITMVVIDHLPNLPFKQDYRSVVTASRPFLQENKYSKEYKGFRSYFSERKLHSNYAQEKAKNTKKYKRFKGNEETVTQKYLQSWNRFDAGIRSAYYVSWDPKSLFSLKQNIRKIKLVIPEWFFINGKTDKLDVSIDAKG